MKPRFVKEKSAAFDCETPPFAKPKAVATPASAVPARSAADTRLPHRAWSRLAVIVRVTPTASAFCRSLVGEDFGPSGLEAAMDLRWAQTVELYEFARTVARRPLRPGPAVGLPRSPLGGTCPSPLHLKLV